MAIPAFPSTLPSVMMSEYGFKPGNAVARTEMDTGLARQRRRFVSVPTEYSVKWKFTRAQFAIFEKFFEEDIFHGAGWFTIQLVNGVGETTYTARFIEPYSVTTIAKEFMWEVTATIEAVGRPLLA